MNPETRKHSKKAKVRVNRPSRLEERKELPKLDSNKNMKQKVEIKTKPTPTPEPQNVAESLKRSTKKSE